MTQRPPQYRRNLYGAAMTWQGAWVGTALYLVGDVVSSGGHVYICVQQNGNTPPPNTAYWQVTG